MKKFILSLVFALAGIFSASAIDPYIEFQPVQAGDGYVSFNFQGGFTGKVHPNIALGAGIGITEEWNFDHSPLIPIFFRAEVSGPLGRLKPFFSFDVGYEINTSNTKWGAVLVNPMVGLKFGSWYMGIGYLAHCWTPNGAHATSCFNMKVGYSF